jgi:hypothetical protein
MKKKIKLNQFLNDLSEEIARKILTKVNNEKYKNLNNYQDLQFDSSVRNYYIKNYHQFKSFKELRNYYRNNN